MSWDTPDVYHQPEHFGLEIVGEVEWSDGCYQYDMTVVWKNAAGELFTADDAGCSCPIPFEYYTNLSSLGEPWNFYRLASALMDHSDECDKGYSSGQGRRYRAEVVNLIERMRSVTS
jgi:hypothetical protein